MSKLRKTIVLLAAGVLTGCELVAGIQDLTYTPPSDLEGGAGGGADSTAGQGDSASGNDAGFDSSTTGEGSTAFSDAAEAGDTGAGDATLDAPGDAVPGDGAPGDAVSDRGAGDATSEGAPGDAAPPADTGGSVDAGDTGAVTGGPAIPGPDGGPLVGADGGVLVGDLIDNIDTEPTPGFIRVQNGRAGTWFTYDDGTVGGIVPAPMSSPSAIVGTITSFNGNAANQAAHMTGNGVATYAGMGFNLNTFGSTPMTYDASAYQGVTFWARIGGDAGTASVRFNMPDRNTSAAGGICTTACSDYLSTSPMTLTPAWRQFVVYFNQLTQQGFGIPRETTLDVAHVYSCQFQVAAGAFDIWVDDIYFIVK